MIGRVLGAWAGKRQQTMPPGVSAHRLTRDDVLGDPDRWGTGTPRFYLLVSSTSALTVFQLRAVATSPLGRATFDMASTSLDLARPSGAYR